MAPKVKTKNKQKKPSTSPPPPPPLDPDEVVTELMKQVFEIQLSDIDKKIDRIIIRQEELTTGTAEIEEKFEEFQKENGEIISKKEQLLAIMEEQKMEKRNEMIRLFNEIKTRIEKHKEHVEELEKRYQDMVRDLTEELEKLEEEVKVLEHYKQNRQLYNEQLEDMERTLEEMEMQQQRTLFEIERKWEMAKVRVKKELESRLLHLSIEFQEISQKRIGNPCHRVTQENKSIQNELRLMKEELVEYEGKCLGSKNNITIYKKQQEKRELEKDKAIARTVVQVALIKYLLKERLKLLENLKEYAAVEADNKILLRRLRMVVYETEKNMNKIEELRKAITDKIEESNAIYEASVFLKRSSKRLQALLRNSLKIAEEAIAVRLIPMGELEEEKFLNSDAKIRLYKKRRDSAFLKKGKILQHLLDFLSKAQLTEEDKKLLKASSETLNLDNLNFSQIYGKAMVNLEKDTDKRESFTLPVTDDVLNAVLVGSDISLPRSISEVIYSNLTEGESGSTEWEDEEQDKVVEDEKEKQEPVEKEKKGPIEKEKQDPVEKEREKEPIEKEKQEPVEKEIIDIVNKEYEAEEKDDEGEEEMEIDERKYGFQEPPRIES